MEWREMLGRERKLLYMNLRCPRTERDWLFQRHRTTIKLVRAITTSPRRSLSHYVVRRLFGTRSLGTNACRNQSVAQLRSFTLSLGVWSACDSHITKVDSCDKSWLAKMIA